MKNTKDVVWLGVAKDNGAFNVLAPVLRLAKEEGFDVPVVCEGFAGPRFYNELKIIPEFMGTVDFMRYPFTFEAAGYPYVHPPIRTPRIF